MSTRKGTLRNRTDVDPYVPEFMQAQQAELADARRTAISRRSFVKLTGLAGGGLVIGFSVAGRHQRAAAQTQDLFAANAYVQVPTSGPIVIFSKNPEVGQGIKTAMPMIVAEELDADWADVRVEQAEISFEKYGAQVAGGSTSIPSNWDSLRTAGATARAMLVSAAAQQWSVPASELRTQSSRVYHDASGRSAHYTELAQAAAALALPEPDAVQLKSRSRYRLLGKRITGVDNEEIVTGAPLFGIDQRLPDMVYASIERAPQIGARVVSANLDHVRSLRGVRGAFVIEQRGNPVEFQFSAPNLLSGVAVIADSTWNAFQARRALEIEWDAGTAATDTWSEHVAQANALAASRPATMLNDSGDVESAFADAATTAAGFYSYPFVSHADLEPQNATAWFKGDSIEIWAPTQTPQGAVEAVAALLDLPQDKVLLHQLRGGGGFGRRLANDSVVEVALIAKEVGVPVKAQWMREDDMLFDYYRPGGFHSLRAGMDSTGSLVAWEDHFVTFARDGAQEPVSAATLSPQEFPANVLGNVRIGQSLLSCGLPTGPWRAPGSNAIAFVMQSFINECAVAANRDHLEFLLELMGEPRWLEPGNTRSLNTERAAAVIRLAAQRAGWGRSMPQGRGLGLAFHFSHAGHVAEVVDASVDENRHVSVHRVTVAADIGPIVNLSGAENQCQGSVIDGLSTAMGLEITFDRGIARQRNFDTYPILRANQAPPVDVHFIQSNYAPTGIGEPALPPAAPALANAIFAATGERVRSMPMAKEGFTI